MLFKIIAKTYEIFLRMFRSVPIQYFCEAFPSRPYPEAQSFGDHCRLDIFVPYRDKWELTRQCLESLLRQERSQLLITVHLIDNGSSEATKSGLKDWLATHSGQMNIIQHLANEPFNFSKLCNLALSEKSNTGESRHFLFLNNDVQLDQPQTLRDSILFLQQNSDCGALGITLLFPDHSIQHLFAAPGVKIIAAHPYKGKSSLLLKEWNSRARQVPAITGAYLMVPAQYFHDVEGFDEKLPTAGQDIDLCLKLQAKGWSCWVLPALQATHLESASRKQSPINKEEVDYIYAKWQEKIHNHPGYPARLSRWSEQPVRRFLEGVYPYRFII